MGRLPLLLMGMACLVAGVWGGLVRLPLNLPLPGGNANWLTFHGPLMVCGFLGTVIGLERAVGLRGWWTYPAPLLTGAGAVMVVGGALGRAPVVLIAIGSLWFWGVTLWVVGLLMVAFSPLESGLRYDAALRSFFLGFVFSMIFGHAPVILPAVMGLQPSFRLTFYSHVGLLHLAVMLRVGADVIRWGPGRQWGGVASALAVGLFLANTVTSFAVPTRPKANSARAV